MSPFRKESVLRAHFMCLLVFLIPAISWGHGEDKPGPNGGFIRMPGGFHTEVVPLGKDRVKVFLLDIQWENPSIKNSSVNLYLSKHRQKKNVYGDCKIELNYYLCTLPRGTDITKKGKITVKAQREGMMGNEAIYDLPLRLQVIDDGHGSHH